MVEFDHTDFGLRGGKEQRELHWGDVKLKQTPDEKEYLEYSVERQTKTRTGFNPSDTRKIKPRMYSAPDLPTEGDPVRVYKIKRILADRTVNVLTLFNYITQYTRG